MVNSLYHFMIYGGIILFLNVTVVTIMCTVFYFIDPRLGTNISLDLIISALFSGKFVS